jgi:molecular chaperone Hsp33
MMDTMDTLQKFMFDNTAVRGELVEISETWQQILHRRAYPTAIRKLLGEMLAAAALLSANLKFNGAIVMQIHGDGPLRLLVVECDSDLRLRATAKLAENAIIDDAAGLQQLVNLHAQGRFAITLDPKDKLPGQQPYQGIVPLEGESIAHVIENYMLRSAQLDTKLWLAADEHVCRGLLLQKLPVEGGIDAPADDELEVWNRTVMLALTLKEQELLDTDIQTLMQRLFWEETIRIFEPKHPCFHCTCTREKVGHMLTILGKEEINAALSEAGILGIDCDFCGQHYDFDTIDCLQLFAAETPAATFHPANQNKH